jgi:hypothetical protein
MNTLSEYNKFTILGPPMRSYAFIILFSVLNATAFAQNTNVTSNSLWGCGLTQTNVWSNLSNQAGLAEITQLSVGVSTKNSFGIKELSSHVAIFALPVSGGVFGLNVAYTGFELYNETKNAILFAI